MRYLTLFSPTPEARLSPPTPEHMQSMGQFVEKNFKAGTLVSVGSMISGEAGNLSVSNASGVFSVSPGPFADSKEAIGGFAIIEATSREHAIEQIKAFLKVAGNGRTDMFLLADAPPATEG